MFPKAHETKSPVLFLFTLDSRLGCGLDWTHWDWTGLDQALTGIKVNLLRNRNFTKKDKKKREAS